MVNWILRHMNMDSYLKLKMNKLQWYITTVLLFQTPVLILAFPELTNWVCVRLAALKHKTCASAAQSVTGFPSLQWRVWNSSQETSHKIKIKCVCGELMNRSGQWMMMLIPYVSTEWGIWISEELPGMLFLLCDDTESIWFFFSLWITRWLYRLSTANEH